MTDVVDFMNNSLVSVRFNNRTFLDRMKLLIDTPRIDPQTGKQLPNIEYGGAVMNTIDDSNIHHSLPMMAGEERSVALTLNNEFYSWHWHTHPWLEYDSSDETRYSRIHQIPSGADMFLTSDWSNERGYYMPMIVFSKHYAYQVIANDFMSNTYKDYDIGSSILNKIYDEHLTDIESGPYIYYDDQWKITRQHKPYSYRLRLEAFEQQFKLYNEELHKYGIHVIMIPNWTEGFDILFPEYRNVPLDQSLLTSKITFSKELLDHLQHLINNEQDKIIYVYSILSTHQYRLIQRVLPEYFYSTENTCNNELIIIIDQQSSVPSPIDLQHIANHFIKCKKRPRSKNYSIDQFLIITSTHVYDFKQFNGPSTTLLKLDQLYSSNQYDQYIEEIKRAFNVSKYTINNFFEWHHTINDSFNKGIDE